MFLFFTFRFLDLIDILLLAGLLFVLYRNTRGTSAVSIFFGLLLLYLLWHLFRGLKMALMADLLGSIFPGLGVVTVIIIFQPEIRRFLKKIGVQYDFSHPFSLSHFQKISNEDDLFKREIAPIISAVRKMAKEKTGTLIILSKTKNVLDGVQGGIALNANLSEELLRTIFFKNSPLHDGATIAVKDKIVLAGCRLPFSANKLSNELGMRHQAALGISERYPEILVILVSEERGTISIAQDEKLIPNLSIDELEWQLKHFWATQIHREPSNSSRQRNEEHSS